jgi:hypothetical protein
VFRSSDADVISFGPKESLIQGTNLDNPASTKQTFSTELVVIGSTSGTDSIVVGASLSPY